MQMTRSRLFLRNFSYSRMCCFDTCPGLTHSAIFTVGAVMYKRRRTMERKSSRHNERQQHISTVIGNQNFQNSPHHGENRNSYPDSYPIGNQRSPPPYPGPIPNHNIPVYESIQPTNYNRPIPPPRRDHYRVQTGYREQDVVPPTSPSDEYAEVGRTQQYQKAPQANARSYDARYVSNNSGNPSRGNVDMLQVNVMNEFKSRGFANSSQT